MKPLPSLLAAFAALAMPVAAHPGSGIVVDRQGNVYFVDTGQGVWRLDTQGKLAAIHQRGYHWMALDPDGHFATAALGDFDRGTFERVTHAGAKPAVIISSDFPITVGRDGALYYVPYKKEGPELVRRTADGQRTIFAVLPAPAGKPMQWINGITVGPDGTLYAADNDAVWKIDPQGTVTAFRTAIRADCSDPLPGVPETPYLRGLAVPPDGTIYAAANGCRAIVAIPATGPIRTVLSATSPWSPTGIVLQGNEIYVLEYLHTPGDNRREWTPRVRKVGSDGRVVTLATVTR